MIINEEDVETLTVYLRSKDGGVQNHSNTTSSVVRSFGRFLGIYLDYQKKNFADVKIFEIFIIRADRLLPFDTKFPYLLNQSTDRYREVPSSTLGEANIRGFIAQLE